MQTRNLLEILIELENILPGVNAGITDLKNQLEAIKLGHLNIKDLGESNLNNLIIELKQAAAFGTSSSKDIDKNVSARTKNAIHLGELYIQQIKDFMAECVQIVNGMLVGQFYQTKKTIASSSQNSRHVMFASSQQDNGTLQVSSTATSKFANN
jgi:hypothetical protein